MKLKDAEVLAKKLIEGAEQQIEAAKFNRDRSIKHKQELLKEAERSRDEQIKKLQGEYDVAIKSQKAEASTIEKLNKKIKKEKKKYRDASQDVRGETHDALHEAEKNHGLLTAQIEKIKLKAAQIRSGVKELESQTKLDILQLRKEFEQFEKVTKDGARESGQKLIIEARQREVAKKEAEERIDQAVHKFADSAERNVNLGEMREVLPRVYRAINVGVKVVVRGKSEDKEVSVFGFLGEVLSSPIEILKAGNLGLDLKKIIEKELSGKAEQLLPELMKIVEKELEAKSITMDASTKEAIGRKILAKAKEVSFTALDLDIEDILKDTVFKKSTLQKSTKEELVKGLKAKFSDVMVNEIIQCKFVATLVKDHGLWEVIRLEIPRAIEIAPKYKDEIGEAIVSLIETPSSITTESKLKLVKEILSSETALGVIADIAKAGKNEVGTLIVESKPLAELFEKYGIDKLTIRSMLPSIIKIVEALPQHRETALKLVEAIEPVVLGKSETIDFAAVLPLVNQLMFSEQGLSPVLADFLGLNRENLVHLLKSKVVREQLQTLGVNDAQLYEVVNAILPVVSKVLENSEALSKVVDKLPDILAAKEGVKPEDIQALIPAIRDLLVGDKSVLRELSQALGENKDQIAGLISDNWGVVVDNIIKAQKDKLAALEKLKEEGLAKETPEKLIEILAGFKGSKEGINEDNIKETLDKLIKDQKAGIVRLEKLNLKEIDTEKLKGVLVDAFDIAAKLTSVENHKSFEHVLNLVSKLKIKDKKLELEPEKVVGIAKELLAVLGGNKELRDAIKKFASVENIKVFRPQIEALIDEALQDKPTLAAGIKQYISSDKHLAEVVAILGDAVDSLGVVSRVVGENSAAIQDIVGKVDILRKKEEIELTEVFEVAKGALVIIGQSKELREEVKKLLSEKNTKALRPIMELAINEALKDKPELASKVKDYLGKDENIEAVVSILGDAVDSLAPISQVLEDKSPEIGKILANADSIARKLKGQRELYDKAMEVTKEAIAKVKASEQFQQGMDENSIIEAVSQQIDLLGLERDKQVAAVFAKEALEKVKENSAFKGKLGDIDKLQENLLSQIEVDKKNIAIDSQKALEVAKGVLDIIGSKREIREEIKKLASEKNIKALRPIMELAIDEALKDKPELALKVKDYLSKDENIEVVIRLVNEVISITPALSKAFNDNFDDITKVVTKIEKALGSEEIDYVQLGKAAKGVFTLIAKEEKLLEHFQVLLRPENIQGLKSMIEIAVDTALKDKPELKQQVLALIDENNLELIGKIAGSAIDTIPVIAKVFNKNSDIIVNKILKGMSNLEKGIFDENTDLNGNDVRRLFEGVMEIASSADVAKIIRDNKEVLDLAIFNAIGLIPDKVFEDMGVSKKLARDASPILLNMAEFFLRKEHLKEYSKFAPALETIINDASTPKQKLDAIFSISDQMVRMLKSEEFKSLYLTQLKPFILNNKGEISAVVNKFMASNPDIAKFKIKGEDIVNVLADEKAFKTLGEAYEAYKNKSYFSMIGKGIKAFAQSKDVRSIACDAIVNGTVVFFRESLYPNFLKRWLVGSRINTELHSAIEEAKGLKGGEKLDLAEAVQSSSKSTFSLLGYTTRFRTFSGLDFGKLEFNNLNVDNFNFKEAKFGSKEKTTLANCEFKNCDFSKCELRGKNIDLSGSEFDMKSLKSLLPILDKAIAQNKGITIDGMKFPSLSGISFKDIQEIKNSEFGKRYLDTILETTKEASKSKKFQNAEKERSQTEVVRGL